MTIDQPCEVSIRHIGFGAIMVGDEPIAPAGAVTLNVLGAILDFDPSRPDRLPSCLVADPGIAVPVLEQLYGDAVAGEVMNRAFQHDEETVICPVVRQPSLGTLIRLAEIRWYQRNAAIPLDPSLLLLEEMTLLAELRGIIETDEDWVGELHRLLGAFMARPQAVRSALEKPEVRALIIAALDVLAAESPLIGDERVTAIAWIHSMERESIKPVRLTSTSDWTGQLRPELALAAGGSPYQGTSTVDWHDVPLGLLSRREDNVRWRTVLNNAERAVTASVEGVGHMFRLLGEMPAPPGGMFFDLTSTGWPMPLATGELALDEDGQQWSGKAAMSVEQAVLLDRLVDEGAHLDVRVRGSFPEPLRDPRVAEAERWSARAVCALRLRNAVGGQKLLGSAEASLEQAANLWKLARRPSELAATRELVERARDESASWTEALTVAEKILVEEGA